MDRCRVRWRESSQWETSPSENHRPTRRVESGFARRLRDRIAELEGAGPSAPETVSELVGVWRRLAAPKRLSPTTLEMTDALTSKHIDPVFQNVKVATLTPEDVEGFLAARSDLSKSTLTKLKRILSQSFDFAVRRRWASWNPASIAEMPPNVAPEKPGRALTRDEAQRLLNVAEKTRNGAWVVVAMTMGLRPGEVSGLTWQALDLDAGVLDVFQSLSRTKDGPRLKEPKTATSTRRLEMPPRTVEALRQHRAAVSEERLLMGDQWPREWADLVFVTSDGTPLNGSNLRRWLRQLTEAAGIDGRVTPKDLRTTAGSLLSHDGGLPLERVADLLGHKDTRTLQAHYRRPVAPSVDTAAEYWG